MERDRVSVTTWVALWTVYLVWGSTYLAIRVAVHPSHGVGLPPLLMAGVRFILAGLAMLAITVRTRAPGGGPDPMGRKQWLAALVIGTALPFGGNGLVSIAEKKVPSGTTALVIATVPIWAALIAAAIGRERLTRRHVAGLTLGFGGIIALVAGTGSGRASTSGLLIEVGAAMSWAAGSVWSARAPSMRRPLVMTGMEMLCGGIVAAIVGLATGEAGQLHLAQVPTRSWVALGYLVVAGSMLAYTAYVWLLANARLSLVTTYAFVNPAVAVVLGALILGESFTLRSAIAMLAVIAGVVTLLRRPAARDDTPGEATSDDESRQDVAA
jgi:drug/metabolite transporter (DMT)-like permease